MNELSKKAIILLLIGTIIGFGIAGAEDYNQETIDVIGSMPDEVYQEIVDDLGPQCTNLDVATEYKENKDYYDSIMAEYYE